MNPIRTQHQLQQRQRQHSPHEQVYYLSPNARASIQQFSNNHNYHPIPTRIPSYNSTVAGASTSTNQPISSYSYDYYPSGIPFVRAGSVDEDLLAQGRGIVNEETRQAIDDDDRRKEQSRLRSRKYRANQKEQADANNLARDGLQALITMHKNSQHTTYNFAGRVVEIVNGRASTNAQDKDRLNCDEDHNEKAAIPKNLPDNQDRRCSRNEDEDMEVRTNGDEGAPIVDNRPNKNVDGNSSTSVRYRSMIPVFRKRGLKKDDIIYSLSLSNEGPNDNFDPNMQRVDDANPLRVDMFQLETLMTVNNLLYNGEMPNFVIPYGEDTTYIMSFCGKYKDSLHDFFHGRGVFDFVQEEKKTGLDHTYQIIDRDYSQFGHTAFMNGRIKKAIAYASTLSHERRFEVSTRRNGGTASRHNSSNKRRRTSSS